MKKRLMLSLLIRPITSRFANSDPNLDDEDKIVPYSDLEFIWRWLILILEDFTYHFKNALFGVQSNFLKMLVLIFTTVL